MNYNYLKNWGIFIGAFDENDLKKGIDKIKVAEYKKIYPQFQYTNAKIKKIGNTKKLLIYLCTAEDFKI